MEILLPYICKWITIILVAAVIIFLAKHGLRVIRIKHGKTEVEFESSKEVSEEPSSRRFPERGGGEDFISDLIKRDFLVFAGTGIVAEGVPRSWKLLLEKLAAEANYEIDLNNISKKEYPDEAQKIFENLVQIGKKNKYDEIIKNALSLKETSWDQKAYDILDTTKSVVTTNFDGTFEASYQRLAENKDLPSIETCTESLPTFTHNIDYEKYKIVYLHGRADEKHIIFKKDDYTTYYPSVSGAKDGDNCLEAYLGYLFERTTIVFIGFSFEDIYIYKALENIYAQLKNRDLRCEDKVGYKPIVPNIRHYALMPTINPKDPGCQEQRVLHEKLEQMGIVIVCLKQKRDWQDWFLEIRKLKPLSKKGKKSVLYYEQSDSY
ncbi:MAG: SIR2 family protein [Sedimentisphaerales bacterium]